MKTGVIKCSECRQKKNIFKYFNLSLSVTNNTVIKTINILKTFTITNRTLIFRHIKSYFYVRCILTFNLRIINNHILNIENNHNSCTLLEQNDINY